MLRHRRARRADVTRGRCQRIRGVSILTSNRAPSDWYALFPNPVVAEGILDRLINSAHHILMDGKSYRPNKRPVRQSDGKQK